MTAERATDYESYVRTAREASELVEAGSYDDAIAKLRVLVDSDISDTDKAMMCMNLAIVYDRIGDYDSASAWLATGARHEARAGGRYVLEQRAAFLADKDRIHESLAIYEELSGRGDLTEDDKERIRKNIEILRDRT